MPNRIKELRKTSDLTLLQIADRLGVSESTVQRYESGNIKNLKYETIVDLSNLFGCSPSYLMGWDSDADINDPTILGRSSVSSEGFVQIPIYASVSAGPGCFAEGNIEGYTSIPDDMARSGDFFGLRVRGSSMDPEIKDQDVVVVRKTNVAESGDTVVAIVNGDSGFVKRLVKYAEGISLVSINATEYPPMIFTAKQIESLPVTIQGVVVRLIRDIKTP